MRDQSGSDHMSPLPPIIVGPIATSLDLKVYRTRTAESDSEG